MVFFPLFATGFVLDDYLKDNDTVYNRDFVERLKQDRLASLFC